MLVAIVAILIQAAAPSGPAVRSKPPRDPSQLICIEQQVTGSRIGGKRVCRTAADWAQDQRDVRMDTEHGQTQARMPGG